MVRACILCGQSAWDEPAVPLTAGPAGVLADWGELVRAGDDLGHKRCLWARGARRVLKNWRPGGTRRRPLYPFPKTTTFRRPIGPASHPVPDDPCFWPRVEAAAAAVAAGPRRPTGLGGWCDAVLHRLGPLAPTHVERKRRRWLVRHWIATVLGPPAPPRSPVSGDSEYTSGSASGSTTQPSGWSADSSTAGGDDALCLTPGDLVALLERSGVSPAQVDAALALYRRWQAGER